MFGCHTVLSCKIKDSSKYVAIVKGIALDRYKLNIQQDRRETDAHVFCFFLFYVHVYIYHFKTPETS